MKPAEWKTKRIGLDWDDIPLAEMEQRIDSIIGREVGLEKVQIYRSASGKGYHVILWYNKPHYNIATREKYWDDPQRIRISKIKIRQGHQDVADLLFAKKAGKRRKFVMEWYF